MNPELKKNLLNADTYKRLAFMVIFAIVYGIVELVIYAVAIAQFFILLFKGELNVELKTFGGAMATYLYDITRFLVFDTEHLPFPFEPWKYSTPAQETPSKEPNDDDMSA